MNLSFSKYAYAYALAR